MTQVLAELGITNEQAVACLAGALTTVVAHALKSALLSPGAIKQIERENVMRDAKLDKLFEKTDRLEKQVLILDHERQSDSRED